jgi:hypothetical protein
VVPLGFKKIGDRKKESRTSAYVPVPDCIVPVNIQVKGWTNITIILKKITGC